MKVIPKMSDTDLVEMYTNAPNEEHEILLWCDGKDVSHAQVIPVMKSQQPSAPTICMKKPLKKLLMNWNDKFVYRQYKLRGRMIVNKQHKDKNTPKLPMIMGKLDKTDKKDFSECISDCAVAITKATIGKSRFTYFSKFTF